VEAVCDQVAEHADREAKRLGCAAAAGPMALLEKAAVGAVLLVDSQWFGLWPVEAACRFGKPVFCCPPLGADPDAAEALCRRIRETRLPVVLARGPRAAPALGQLRRVVAEQLGPVRLVLCEALQTGETGFTNEEEALLDACAELLPGEPRRLFATDLPGGHFATLMLEFPDGRALQMTRCTSCGPRGGVRIRVIAERGTAVADLPHHVHWTDADGGHTLALAEKRPTAQILLEHFFKVVHHEGEPCPGLDQAERLVRWGRAALRSRQEGRWIDLLGKLGNAGAQS
jgi:predicted dehydrogenase